MTKKYNIISLNGFMYAVDKEATLVGAFTTDGMLIYPPSETRDALMKKGEEHLKTRVSAIFFTNNPSLNLPLLPAVEEDIDWIEKNGYLLTIDGHFIGIQAYKERKMSYWCYINTYNEVEILSTDYKSSRKEAIFEALYQFSQYLKEKK